MRVGGPCAHLRRAELEIQHEPLNAWLFERLAELNASVALERLANDPATAWRAIPLRAEEAFSADAWVADRIFDRTFLDTVVRRMDDNEDIFKRILDEPAFRQTVLDHYAERLYGRLRAEHDQLGLPGPS